jgi:hypothetical protein
MASLTAVSLCDALHRAVYLDEFPERAKVAAIFGMLCVDKSIVLGVWQCIVKNGLATRQKLLAAIRAHAVKDFFHAQHQKLLVLRVPVCSMLLSSRYEFDCCYTLAADPRLISQGS